MQRSSLLALVLMFSLAAMLTLAATACGTSQPTSPEEAAARLGDTKAYWRIYSDKSIRGKETGARLKDVYTVLVNQGHSRFASMDETAAPLNLAQEELLLRDDLMYEMLDKLDDEGFFDESKGTRYLAVPPEEYVRSLSDEQRPQRWIAVWTDNRVAWLSRPSDVAVTNPELARHFRACEVIFTQYVNLTEPKGMTGDGITGDDFRRSAQQNSGRLPR